MSQSSKTPAELPAASSRRLEDTSRWKSGPPCWLGSGGVVAPQQGEKWEKRVPPKPSKTARHEDEEVRKESPKPSRPPSAEETASLENTSVAESLEGVRAPVCSEASSDPSSDVEASGSASDPVALAEADEGSAEVPMAVPVSEPSETLGPPAQG
jgi:hypothetical protein